MSLAGSLADVLPAGSISPDTPADAWPHFGREPEAVARPGSVDEIAATMQWAASAGIGVLPVASGDRFVGSPPDRPFVVLSMDRMTGIEIYEPADLTLTARAGTLLVELDRELREHRQWLPFDPPHADERSLGGLVATAESGPLWMGYGELRNHVLGMTVVTGDGRVLKLGGRVVKNVAGFDLLKPLVGSRGRLAVIASVCVRAFPTPACDRVLVLRAESASALSGPALAVGSAPTLPVSSVLVSPAPALGAAAALLVRLQGGEPTVNADQSTLERHCGVAFERADDAAELIRSARDQGTRDGAELSLSVLPSRLGEALRLVDRELGQVELAVDTYAARIRISAARVEPATPGRLREGIEALGGGLSVHAPGRPELSAARSRPSAAEAELIAGVERVFDPREVLWPCRL
jgi:FAD/FMN-containing dehydrogenase